MNPGAVLSKCRRYRYTLWRDTGIHNQDYVMFIGLNPSTADETKDDPTIRRCVGFARDWGYGKLCMTNLFALRTTNPKDMLNHQSPIGELNNAYLMELGEKASITIAAWGDNGAHLQRDQMVRAFISKIHCLKLNKSGQPAHPLYLPANLKPKEWR